MSGKHTPGPWKNTGWRVEAGSITYTSNLTGEPGELRANATLIAAAPELLEALKLAEEHLAFHEETHHCEWEDPADCCECTDLAKIREVISKAEGPQVNRCPHSACSQNHIDTGETECVEGGE